MSGMAIVPTPTPSLTDSGYSRAVLTDRPVVYYRLDERSGRIAHNFSGNGIDATYGPKTTLGVIRGVIGKDGHVEPAAYSPVGNMLTRTPDREDTKLPSFNFIY